MLGAYRSLRPKGSLIQGVTAQTDMLAEQNVLIEANTAAIEILNGHIVELTRLVQAMHDAGAENAKNVKAIAAQMGKAEVAVVEAPASPPASSTPKAGKP